MGLISRVSSRTYRFIIMTLGEDEAHALLIKNTTGVDLTQNEANDSPSHAAADSNELKKRRDGHLSHVVINDEAVEAQLQGFRPQSVPFPFRNAEEYERSLRMPLGKDFNTHEASQSLTKPPVKTKAGQVITPMERGDAFQTTKQDQKKERSKKKTAL